MRHCSALLLQRSRSVRSVWARSSAALATRASAVPRTGAECSSLRRAPADIKRGLASEPVRVARRLLAQGMGGGLTIGCPYALISVARVEPRDPDSSLYVAIARSLEHRPLAAWIAPTWPEGRAHSGLFREHPAVFFWPAAALARVRLDRGRYARR